MDETRIESAHDQVIVSMTNPLVGHVLGSHGHVLLSHVFAQGLVGHMMSHMLGHMVGISQGHVVEVSYWLLVFDQALTWA